MDQDLEQRVALDALDLLAEEERVALRHALERGGAAGAARWYDTSAALAQAFAPVEPPPGLRQAILDRVGGSAPKPFVSAPFSFVMRDEGWLPHPLIVGIHVKQLALDDARGVATLLMKVAPGTEYPAHHHHGHEECYVIEGDLSVEGRELRTGDFHHAEGGSDHGLLHTVGGCTVLLVVDLHDYLS